MLLGLDVLVSPSCCVGNYVVCIVELADGSNLYRHVESAKLT